MQCRHVRPRIDDYVGGSLAPEEASIVREHLDACAACRRDLEAALALHQAFRRLRLRNESMTLAEADVDRIARRAIMTPPPPVRWPWFVSIAAAFVLGIGLALTFMPPKVQRETVREVVQVPLRSPPDATPVGLNLPVDMTPEEMQLCEIQAIRALNEVRRRQGRPRPGVRDATFQ